MSIDADGYGFPGESRTLGRLKEDLRILSPAGIERAAGGWERHVGEARLDAFHQAERRALHALEQGRRGAAWDEIRQTTFGLTEGGSALISWKAEHGDTGHKAERAALGAALALVAADLISPEDYATLARPMAEALPWLLPETAAA
jgi:hypothetical protein